jgi:hypothetical protein
MNAEEIKQDLNLNIGNLRLEGLNLENREENKSQT